MGIRRQLESAVEAKIVRHAKRLGLQYIKLNIEGRRGWPDRLFFIPGGRPLLMEVKRPGERLRPLQAYVKKQLRELDYDVCSTNNAEEGIAYLQRAFDQSIRK